jgi:hypothetical protein
VLELLSQIVAAPLPFLRITVQEEHAVARAIPPGEAPLVEL